MSAPQFAMAPGLIVIVAFVIMLFGVWWINRPKPFEPTEYGDGEP